MSFYSQPTYILDIGDSETGPYIYIGDRWNPNNLLQLTYVFLPLNISDGEASIDGVSGSGRVDMDFTPSLQVDVADASITPPTWKLLSLKKPANATTSVLLAGGLEEVV